MECLIRIHKKCTNKTLISVIAKLALSRNKEKIKRQIKYNYILNLNECFCL